MLADKFQLVLRVKGDLVPDTRSSVTAGKVPADRWIAVLNILAPHRLPNQVSVIQIDPKFPHAADESPRSLPSPVGGLPMGGDSPEKYRSKCSLSRQKKKKKWIS